MNWETLKQSRRKTTRTLAKVGQFRRNHPAVGAGYHKMISNSPYWFSRTYKTDKVVIGLDLPTGTKEVNISGIFDNGTKVKMHILSATMPVIDGKVSLTNNYQIVLLEKN